ncbi:hypothetical protein J23TS9_35670 [Paenibacillus sp. J23TS9]|uniref:DUF1049 domain-containing protein n=1 Tax=Paenibacillus dokdonensis TaxID=2567944 RepID=A0ABU6GQW1_9BACL|nr:MULTISPECIES: hypothetical protein [Paenibacillus]MEC0241105.1 hypothetical protein [Paenibacillus dokdonensis]GIP28437.1 hypothetical protein J23TS9_35670 [Paenibacillus sp. J23TS9]
MEKKITLLISFIIGFMLMQLSSEEPLSLFKSFFGSVTKIEPYLIYLLQFIGFILVIWSIILTFNELIKLQKNKS